MAFRRLEDLPKPRDRRRWTVAKRRFCEEYLVDGSLYRAYLRAGYQASSRDIATQSARDLMEQWEVREYISELMAERSHRTGVTADRVVEELGRVAFAKITDVVRFSDEDGVRLLNSEVLTSEASAAIEAVSSKTTTSVGGSVTVHNGVKMHSKVKALQTLAKIMGLDNDIQVAARVFKREGYDLLFDGEGRPILVDTHTGQRVDQVAIEGDD